MTDPKPKKWIKLKERADIGGEVRSPAEGAILAPADRAGELIAKGKAEAASPRSQKAPLRVEPVEIEKADG